MNHNVEFKGFESPEKIRKLIEGLITRLDKKARGFSPDTVFLRLLVEENPAHKVYNISLNLDVPGKTISAKEQGHALEAGIRSAFSEVERQLLDYKAMLRREHLWKRLARRDELRQRKVSLPASEQRDRESFFALVNPHLNALSDFISHEIAY